STRVFSIFTPRTSVQWHEIDSVLIGQHLTPEVEKTGRSKIAAFDLDDTLITINGSHKYPKDENDWKWWSKIVPKKIKQIYEEGYKVVIISNQGSFESSKKTSEKKRKDFMNKINHMANNLNIPFEVYVATARDKYRKPMIGIWNYIIEHGNDGVDI
ncbi:10364_t:CDS:2, partial [Funneliformis caledonium]